MAISVASVVATCSVCGEPLNAKGDCLACLLRTGLDESLVEGVSPASLIFGDFEIVRREDGSIWQLGRGGMGVTYLARDKVLRRRVALKVIDTPTVSTHRDSQTARERFLREARAAAALRHPNVAAVFQFGATPDGSRCFYAMELVEGETLETRVRREGPLNAKIVLEIAIQIAQALIAAAAQGLIHRDLKPGNIMLTPGNAGATELEVKIIDFGLAKAIADAGGEMDITHGEFVGTPNFASPEQFENGPVDVRSDIYSLGATLWFALTGKTPFIARTIEEIRRAQKSDPLPIEQLKVSRVPSRLRLLLKSMLAIEPAARPGIRDLAARLRLCSADATNVRRNRIAITSIVILIFGASIAFIFQSLRTQPSTAESASNPALHEKRIAVLPFENLSNDREDASFADGVQDDLLTKLAKIADLKVISRTSVMQYRGKRDTQEIGDALRVSHVLEGSVRKTGAWLHINAQLIDTRSDTHVWAEQYDRDLKDLFAIQSEIAQKVAERLQAKISAAEKVAIERPPTADLTAFDFYNRAKKLLLDTAVTLAGTRKADFLKAADLLNQAVAHDPTFFQAYCLLAWTHDYIYYDSWDRTATRLALADAAIQDAFRLRPDAGEAHLARAWHLYLGYRDYNGALAHLESARPTLPNDARLSELKGYIERRQGRWDESARDLEHAIVVDPRNFVLLQQIAHTYKALRRYADEGAILDRALAVEPDHIYTKITRAYVDLDWKADTRPAHQLIDELRAKDPGALQSIADYWLDCALTERDPVAAAAALAALGDRSVGNETMKYSPSFMQGLVGRMIKDDAKARAAFTAARTEQEKLVRANPDDPGALCILGLIDAGLGRKEEALREGGRTTEMLPLEKDAQSGTRMIVCLAKIAAWVGDNDLACEQLRRVSRLPNGVSYGDLKLKPWWDPLRGDPRFEQIVASLAPTGINHESVGAKTTIAVLPFENATNDPKAEYLSEGISEALINSLTELHQLRVIARSTAFHYKGKDIDPRRVGRELQVAAVLTGRVRQLQDALSVQVDLVDANTGAQLWGAGYDGKISDVIAVKQAIAREVTEKLKLKLSGEEQRQLVKLDSTNAEAYQFYLRGRYFWNKRTPDGIKRAFEQFQQAIERDPNFALGYVGLADSYTALTFYNLAAPHEAMPKAKESALKALALDNTLAEAHASLAHISMNYYWDWATAEKEFKRSIELKPDYATAHQWYAIHYLTATGRLDEALQEMRKALELEPASLVMNTFMGATLYYAGRYDEAIDQCRRTIEMDPNFAVAHWHLGLAYEQKQVFDGAIEEFQTAIALSGGSPLMRAALGHAYAMSHQTYETQKVLDELHELSKQQYVSPYEVAAIYVAIGDNEQAFQLLEKACAERSFHLVNLNVSPQFRSVRSDPRFQDLVRRIGVPR
jgi:TolB-like protein/Tfp pilus assembly protein PilF